MRVHDGSMLYSGAEKKLTFILTNIYTTCMEGPIHNS